MGFLWAILMPMMVVAAGALVRKAFAFASGKPMESIFVLSVRDELSANHERNLRRAWRLIPGFAGHLQGLGNRTRVQK